MKYAPFKGTDYPKGILESTEALLHRCLGLIENYWLKNPQQAYLIGDDITLADISCACEIA